MPDGTFRWIEKPGVRRRDRAVMANVERRWCFWCGRYDRPVHGAHAKSRGAGGHDDEENVFGLCDVCHGSHHNGKSPTADQLRAKLAAERGGGTGSSNGQ
ncbi:MAG TPA: hypothetical protein VK324_04465 [Tepidisphaeraceae bacterium]|nr:hypothetical protein [Tepidisphaeraceae bacterium]